MSFKLFSKVKQNSQIYSNPKINHLSIWYLEVYITVDVKVVNLPKHGETDRCLTVRSGEHFDTLSLTFKKFKFILSRHTKTVVSSSKISFSMKSHSFIFCLVTHIPSFFKDKCIFHLIFPFVVVTHFSRQINLRFRSFYWVLFFLCYLCSTSCFSKN